MITETQKRYWFEIFYDNQLIGEGDEESRLEVVKQFIKEHPHEIFNYTRFDFRLVSESK